MKRSFLAAACILTFLIALPGSAQTYGALLTGAQEVPGPGDADGFGTATVTFNSNNSVTVSISVTGIGSTISASHIHPGAAGAAASPIVGFTSSTTTFQNGVLNTTVPDVPVATLNSIRANPSGFYVNVHTPAFPNGAIRGQLTPAPTSSAGAFVFAGDLAGSRENPPVSPSGNGAFNVRINDTKTRLYYDVITEGLTAPIVASHIHKQQPGVNGPVVIGFNTGSTPGGRISGFVDLTTATDAIRATVDEILANPAAFYVNVHTTTNPGGEIRGQLAPAIERFLSIAGKVTSGSGANFVSDVRIFNPSFDRTVGYIMEYFPAGGTNPLAAQSALAVIPARATLVLDDIVGTLFATSGTGAIRVSSDKPLVVTSRIFDDQRAAGQGTVGQFVPGLSRAEARRSGVLPQLSFTNPTTPPSGYRTNIGLFNPNDANVTILMTLRDSRNILATTTLVVGPMHQRQQAIFAGFFTNPNPNFNLLNMTLSFEASAPVFVYGSVLDNITEDAIFVVAQEDVGVNVTP